MQFQDIIGIEASKQQLLQAVKRQHLAHALLFRGAAGSAKLALALAFAQYLHCENPQENDSCGTCQSCYKHQKFIHPDLHFVMPVSSTKKIKSKPISKDFLPEWRQFLQAQPYAGLSEWLTVIDAENKEGNISVEESRQVIQTLSLKAFEGKYKIMLIWLPEMMNLQAANAILKVLEEPTPNTIFLMVGESEQKLLTTIISRVQLFNVPHFSDEAIAEYLQKHKAQSPENAQKIAYLAEGNLQEALSLLAQPEKDQHAIFREWMRICYRRQMDELIAQSENIAALGRESQKALLTYGLSMLRETILWQNQAKEIMRLPDEALKFVEGFAKTMQLEKVDYIAQLFNEAIYHIERNANPKLTFLDISLKIAQIIRV